MGDLHKALLKAKAEIGAVVKDQTGQIQSRQYRYADLTATLETVEPVLAENGLVLFHRMDGNGLHTVLAHAESGEEMASCMPIDWEASSQSVGSQLTYFRRYAIHAMLGLRTEDDDDGAAAMRSRQAASPPPPAPQREEPARPHPAAAPAPTPAAPLGDWWQEKVGFGKHKERTWADMAGGSFDGEAHGYLKWALRNIDDKPEFLNKVKAALAALEDRHAQGMGDNEIPF